MLRLWLRPDVIDTALLPPPREANLDIGALVELTDRLAKADFANAQQLSLSQWLAAASAMLKLTEQQARLYFELYQCVIENQPIKRGGMPAEDGTVNTYKFMVFLFAQLLGRNGGMLQNPHLSGGDVWPATRPDIVTEPPKSPVMSPRSIALHSKHTEENNHLVYAKLHFKELLEIISKADGEGLIGREQFEFLRILFEGDENKDGHAAEELSSIFGGRLWKGGKKEAVGTVLDVVRSTLCQFPGVSDLDEPNIVLDGIHRKTILRSDTGKEDSLVKIVNCHNAYLYILAPVKFVSVFGSANTTIVVGAVSKIINVEHCENVKVITACHHMRVHNCVSTSLYVCTNTRPTLLGDNRDVVFAPYNTVYPSLEDHLKRASIDPKVNLWDQPEQVQFSSSDPAAASTHTGFTILPAAQFSPFMIPFRMAGSTKVNPCRIPENYSVACQNMQKEVLQIRGALKEAKMDDGTKDELQKLIQTQFKEWLVNTGNIRQVQDLMHFDQHVISEQKM